jgi:2-keto-4-pentenoate hydratase
VHDPRAVEALRTQLTHRRATLSGGARHVGWKLGVGDAERIGDEQLAVGHLTTATVLSIGGTYHPAVGMPLAERPDSWAADAERPMALAADAEIAVTIGRDCGAAPDLAAMREAIGGYAGALELVDLADVDDTPEAIVARNVFHRAVAFGPSRSSLPVDGEARLVVDGAVRAAGPAAPDLAARVCAAARLLSTVGEELHAGDRVITGSIVQVRIDPGSEVVADFGVLGSLHLTVAG